MDTKPISSIEQVLEIAIEVSSPMTVHNGSTTIKVKPDNFAHFDDGYYEVMRGVIGFKTNGTFYFAPYSKNIENILIKQGYWHRGLFFPFTYESKILEFDAKWEEARLLAENGML